MTVTVDQAWTAVMEEIRSVGKGDFNQDQGFRFRGVDSVVNATGPAFRTHGIKVIPKRIVDIVRSEYETRRGFSTGIVIDPPSLAGFSISDGSIW